MQERRVRNISEALPEIYALALAQHKAADDKICP